jgi:DNA-binding NarL/FixJ family response regulator
MNADASPGDSPDQVPGAESTHLVHVFAVDDHPAFLRSVMSVVSASAGFDLVGTASTGAEALSALSARHDIDLVLLDVHLPDVSGIEVARRCAAHGGCRIIVLMSTTDPGDLPADAFDRGVAGFLAKEQLSTATLRSLWFDASR